MNICRYRKTAFSDRTIINLGRVLILLASVLLSACGINPVNDTASTATQTSNLNQEDQWGVRILGIHTTAAGYMLDFRYRVVDAKKATPILNRKIKPELIVENDGRKLRVPVTSKLGPLRQSAKHVQEDRNYFMFFANPGRHVKKGDKVSVVIGDFKVSNLTVN